ncbi:MAG TPA: aminotransferase class I/II-fold pyridoxal phosphate-dependent enzyme [Ilumatobacteraceae bacterium]|nr:aminotransferase class I/II-fold pyridoxal phosphate-dependent enzyme [Ilumatobacteraceae bacterium]
MTLLAMLGGEPVFPAGLKFARPAAPPLERVVARLEPSYDLGILTNGPLVRELELQVANRLGVDHVVAVSSCTAGLMLTLQALVPPGRPVLMPSFTFAATAHAAAWVGGIPRFAECGDDDFLLDVDDAAHRIDGSAAILATHVFGAPCHPERVEELGSAHGIPVVFDAAHALGALRNGRPVGGFGIAEVFSLSPTKLVVSGEGGLVTTNDEALAARIRIGRDYGNPGTYDTKFAGLNARLSEMHAALALESLEILDDHLARRAHLVARYRTLLAAVPGIIPQQLTPGDASTHKDFTIVVDETVFGVERDLLALALRAEGIDTRCYFSPPVHRHEAYRGLLAPELPRTDQLASRVISLPLWRDLDEAAVEAVADTIARVHEDADAVGQLPRSA